MRGAGEAPREAPDAPLYVAMHEAGAGVKAKAE
jgi:hypothetical protein